MAIGDIFVGDEGTSVGGTVKDQDKAIVDVSGAISKKIRITDPSGTMTEHDAAFITDGTDGGIHYITTTGDIDTAGLWYYQGYVELPLGKWFTDIHSFEVETPL